MGDANDNRTYEEGRKLGFEQGLRDAQERVDDVEGASKVLFDKWKWQPEVIKAASTVWNNQDNTNLNIEGWQWKESIIDVASKIWSGGLLEGLDKVLAG